MGHAITVAGIRILEVLFAGGLIGSAILVIITSIEDFREVFDHDDEKEPPVMQMAAD
jgi:hypothetical protein